MKLRSEVTWIQQPVGHGGFHTGVATSPHGRDLRWIFDVGSTSLKTLRTRLKAWLGESPAPVDWLFISHFDNDHVNGLEDLFRMTRVRSVMLPWVNDEAFAHALCEAALERSAAWMFELLADPVGWFASRGVERIYLLLGGEGPDDDREDGLAPDGDRPAGPDTGPWKEKITPQPIRMGAWGAQGRTANGLFLIPPGRCRIWTSDGLSELRFEPYKTSLDPWPHAFLIARLCQITGEAMHGSDLRVRLSRAVALKARSSQGRKDIKAAYVAAVGNSNRGSLSLLTVLDPDPSVDVVSVVKRNGLPVDARDGAVGWASTGDAELLDPVDLSEWSHRYRADLDRVMVLAVPHHGSDHNSDAAFQHLNRRALLAAHVRKGASKHPGTNVKTVGGKRLALVTGEPDSAVTLKSVLSR